MSGVALDAWGVAVMTAFVFAAPLDLSRSSGKLPTEPAKAERVLYEAKLSRKQIKRKGVSLKAMDAAEVAVAVPAASPPPG